MKLLALESSATSASVALLEDGLLRGEFFINTKLTHSQTLMPMVESLLKQTNVPFSEIDRFAVAAGPGSFTGIRIGVAAIKGMAMAAEKPCVSVSTLEAMAYQVCMIEGIACAVMDARCNQVYNALFEICNGHIRRLTPDRALAIEELEQELIQLKKRIFFVGDGAQLCYNKIDNSKMCCEVAPAHLQFQHAASVAQAAFFCAPEQVVTASALMPVYLRLPQAERELKRKQGLTKGENS